MTDDSTLHFPPTRERGSSLAQRAQSPPSTSTHFHSHPRQTLDASSHEQSRKRRSIDNNLPKPPPQDRVPPPSKGVHGAQKLGIFRKGRRGSRSNTPSPLPIDEDDDDEWLLEGTSTNGQVNATVSVGREASTLSRSVDALSLNDDPIMPHVSVPSQDRPPEKRRGSKSRSLAKKTSRLFQRSNGNNNNSNSHDEPPAPSGSTLPIPLAGRQSSFSSVASGETTSSSRKFGLVRVASRGSPKRSQLEGQPSSWHPPTSFPQRRASSSTQDSAETSSTHGLPTQQPLRHRQSGSYLSASVPTLTRHSAPPRGQGPGVSQQSFTRQETPGVGIRMSSWVSNIFSSNDNTANNSPASITSESTQHPPSPLRKTPSAATNFFSGVRNKAVGGMRYLLDSDAQPDQCQETMWVMGVAHPGWSPDEHENPDHAASPARGDVTSPWLTRMKDSNGTQPSPPRHGLSGLFASSFNLAQQADPPTPPGDQYGKSRKDKSKEKEAKWPEDFYEDFRSTVWCTYRNQFAPILSLPQHYLLPNPEAYYGAFVAESNPFMLPMASQLSTGTQQARQSNGPWGWVKGDERGLTSDSGWGCMLRTGQSMLANALIAVHLGRDWRLPQKPNQYPESPAELAELEAYGKYVRILSWFLDDPSPLCPFSVHRMALIGKELGKEVGEWFGPSTASGALKTLANSFPICGLSVANAVDGIIYRSDVYAASNTSSDEWEADAVDGRSRSTSVTPGTWGDKAVLILIGLRLGVDGVNPLYYDSIKTLFTYPQSVGIAGGRPSSSYYFVASQANSLFYLDPHFTRAAVPLRTPPSTVNEIKPAVTSPTPDNLNDDTLLCEEGPLTPISPTVSISNQSAETPVSPPQRRRSRRAAAPQKLHPDAASPPHSPHPASPTTPTRSVQRPSGSDGGPHRDNSFSPTPAPTSRTSSAASRPSLPVDPQTAWYANAYTEAQLHSFHCDRVKKLPLSGLDPSMLVGFLCTSEAEFDDLCDRIAKLPQRIFAVQDEMPTWSDDEDGALESVSEPASGPEMSDDESDSEQNISGVLAADEVDEFGRISSRPASPGQTIGPRSATPSDTFSTVRTPQRDDFEFVNTEAPFEPRPEVGRNDTIRPGQHSRGSSLHSRGASQHSRGPSLDHPLDGGAAAPEDEEDDIEMLRPESSVISDSVDVKIVSALPVRSVGSRDGSEVDSTSDHSCESGAGAVTASVPVAAPVPSVSVGPVEASVEEPVKEPIEESVEEPIEASVEEPVEEPIEESVKEPVEVSVQESVVSVKSSVEESTVPMPV